MTLDRITPCLIHFGLNIECDEFFHDQSINFSASNQFLQRKCPKCANVSADIEFFLLRNFSD